MALLSPLGPQFFQNDGTVAALCKLYTRLTGTTTPANTYSDQAGAVPHTNPIVLDSAGRVPSSKHIWLTAGTEYRYRLETADGVLIWELDDIYGISGPTDTISESLVTVQRSESNAVQRTLNFYIQHSKLLVANYCDPTSDTASQVATALANAITDAKAGGKALEFETATYTTNAETAFLGSANLRGLRFWGNGCTIYRNTGAGPVVSLDSSADASRCDDIEFLDFNLRGQASATYGLDTRGVHRSKIRARAYDIATAGFRTRWSVLTDHDFTVSNNIHTFAVNPATGLLVTQSSAGNYSACNKYHVVMEGPITDLGVDYEYGGLGNIFTGSCENIPRGFRQRSTAADAVLHYMDFEGNSVYDLLIEGRGLEVMGGECSSAGSGSTIALASTASDVSFRGGYRREINIDSAATGITINDTALSDNVALGINGTGSANWRGTGNVEVDTNRAITAIIPDQFGDTGSYTATLTGCTTSPTTSIAYRRVGDMVFLDIPALSATSNTTAATITGMPAAIRPSAARSDIGSVTDNSAVATGKIVIETSGVLTLHVNQSATFTNAGTKGVQACTIAYKV